MEPDKSNTEPRISHQSQRRKSILVARIEVDDTAKSGNENILTSSAPTTGFRFISCLRGRKASISQSADGPLIPPSYLDKNQINSNAEWASKSEGNFRPRRGSIVLLSVPPDNDMSGNQTASQANEIKTPSVVAGIKFLRSKKKSSFRLGYTDISIKTIKFAAMDSSFLFVFRKALGANRRSSISVRPKSDSSDDESISVSVNEPMLKAARMLASAKSELSQQSLLSRFLSAWKITSETRFVSPIPMFLWVAYLQYRFAIVCCWCIFSSIFSSSHPSPSPLLSAFRLFFYLFPLFIPPLLQAITITACGVLPSPPLTCGVLPSPPLPSHTFSLSI